MKKLWAKLRKISALKLWIAFVFIKVLDIGTTYYFLNETTAISERNLVWAYMFERFGINTGLAMNFALTIPLSYLLSLILRRPN